MQNSNNISESSSNNIVTKTESADRCAPKDGRQDGSEQHDRQQDLFGTIAARVQLEIEPFDDPSATDVLEVLSETLSSSPVPLVDVKDTKLMYMGEQMLSVSSCNLVEYDILLTPYPFKKQSLENLSDCDLMCAIDLDIMPRLVSRGTESGEIADLRVLSINREPLLPLKLAQHLASLDLYPGPSAAFDWSNGVIPHEKLLTHTGLFEEALELRNGILEDGMYSATVEIVTIEKDRREIDVWAAVFSWRIDGKEGAAPWIVSGRWYYPINPESDARYHIFNLLRPWLGSEALKSGDLDLHSLVGRKCKLLIIRSYEIERHHRRTYSFMETPIWAVLPADFQMK